MIHRPGDRNAHSCGPKCGCSKPTKPVVDIRGVLLWGNTTFGLQASPPGTQYFDPGFSATPAGISIPQFHCPVSGFLKNLYVRQAGNVNDPINTVLYRLRINNAPTFVTTLVAVNSTGGSNLVDTASVEQGDLLDIEIVKANLLLAAPFNIVVSLAISSVP